LNAQPGQKKETLGSYAQGQRAADKKDVVSGTAASENKLGVLSGMQTGLNNLGAYGGGLQQGSLLRTGTNDRAFLPGDSLYQANPEADKNEAIIRSGQAIEGSGSRLQFFGDIASHSAKRANENFAEAEKYVKQGKYYQAADSYGLAAIYSENNALVFAAKSHALFAAGQYMSSSLFLSRALASLKGQQSEAASEKPQNGTFIDCSIFRSNLGLIERDTVENRIADIEKLSLETNASELQFLLGYVYYQIGRVEKAQDAIRKAYEKNPESDAIVTLKGIIERSLSESGPAKKP
jgi:tetratricopeptide (TPR) repeat protein